MKKNKTKIIEIIKDKGPISAPDILSLLNKKSNSINKTTVYRNINSMIETGLIKEVRVNTEKAFYELSDLDHHHHFVCESCGKIDEISDSTLERAISKLEEILKAAGKKIKRHDLEFYGNCINCN